MRTLDRDHIVLCPTLMLEAMAIKDDIFVEDLLLLNSDASHVPYFPYKLTMKPGAGDKPIFTQRRYHDKDFVAGTTEFLGRTPGERPAQPSKKRKAGKRAKAGPAEYFIGPMTTSSATHIASKVGLSLGWLGFSFRSYRYGYARKAMNAMSHKNAKYLLGHRAKSLHASTTYQPPDRHVDVTASIYDADEDFGLIDAHSSVTWEREQSLVNLPPLDEKLVENDPVLKKLLDKVAIAEDNVIEKYKVASHEVSDDDANKPLVQEALELWADIVWRYADLTTKVCLVSIASPFNTHRPPVLRTAGGTDEKS